ncbi:MAG: DegV family protein [Defluviitaleaceae bacterium]|nr:DegV family protein [Defluviitaleaceae bacterium]
MFHIISDGGCDFTKAEIQKHNIDVIPFYVTFDQVTYLKEGVDISKEEYFKRLLEDKTLFPKTSQPSPQDYIDMYTPHLEAGKDIISLTISSKLSGTYNSATLAANTLKDDYPDRTIIVIDSLNCAIGQGLILKEIIKMRDSGLSIAKTAELTEKVIMTAKIYFTLDSLEYLKRGGRVGPTTALVGGILGLRPVLHLVDGVVEQLDSVRGKKKVLQLMEEGIVDALKGEEQDINLCVGHILSVEEAAAFKAGLEGAMGIHIPNEITEVGATIGTHAGPGALAVAYCKKYETFVR